MLTGLTENMITHSLTPWVNMRDNGISFYTHFTFGSSTVLLNARLLESSIGTFFTPCNKVYLKSEFDICLKGGSGAGVDETVSKAIDENKCAFARPLTQLLQSMWK